MNNTSQAPDEILITSDVLSRYKISRSTLYFWSTPSRMPSFFSQPFPKPRINGSPKRWRLSDLLAWEENVGIKPEVDQSGFPDDSAKRLTNTSDHPGNHAGYSVP
ncbi:TPA: helix-turn-helix transcriptional regulator [Raoultella ornithinolytica]